MKPSTTLGSVNKKTINRVLELSNKVYLNHVLFQTFDALIQNNKICTVKNNYSSALYCSYREVRLC